MTPTACDPAASSNDALGLRAAAEVILATRPPAATGMTTTVWDPGSSGNDDLVLCVVADVVSVAGHPRWSRRIRGASRPGRGTGMTATAWDLGPSGDDDPALPRPGRGGVGKPSSWWRPVPGWGRHDRHGMEPNPSRNDEPALCVAAEVVAASRRPVATGMTTTLWAGPLGRRRPRSARRRRSGVVAGGSMAPGARVGPV